MPDERTRKTMRRRLRLLVTATPALTLLAGVAFTQSEITPRDAAATPGHEVRLLGHDQMLRARITNGKTGRDAVTLGSLADFTANVRSGRLHSAIVRLHNDDTLVAVAWSSVRFSPATGAYSIAMTRRELAGMPSVEPAHEPAGPHLPSAGRPRTGLLHAAALDEWQVVANSQRLGTPQTLFVEPTVGVVAFVAVPLAIPAAASAGLRPRHCLVPWSAFETPVANDRRELRLAKAGAVLAAAPRRGRQGELTDMLFRRRLYDFFDVSQPTFERLQNDATSAAETRQPRAGR